MQNLDIICTSCFKRVEQLRNFFSKEKNEKIFTLTFKGFLASLSQTNIHENFWIKSYIQFIKEITNEKISEYFLLHMYNHIMMFFTIHSKNLEILTKYKNPEIDFHYNYDFDFAFHIINEKTIRNIPKKYHELFLFSSDNFFISSYELGHLIKQYVQQDNIEKCDDVCFDAFLDYFFRNWMNNIFLKPKQLKRILKTRKFELGFDEDYTKEKMFILDNFGEEYMDNVSFRAIKKINEMYPDQKLDLTSWNTNSLFRI